MGSFGFDFRDTLGTTYTGRPTKTGTTICGLVFEGGVVLGADTRSTNGETVADKNCEKIHRIDDNIFCCGAGTAADTESLTGLISSSLNLHRMQSGRQSRVKTALALLKSKLFQYQGHIGAALVLGGVDREGPHLFTVYPHGSSDALPYAAMGSGSLAAIAVLETGYDECLSEDKAKLLVTRAIMAGILNDLGSGSTVDLCVLSSGGATYLRNFHCGAEREMQSDTLELDVGKTRTDRTNISTATRIL